MDDTALTAEQVRVRESPAGHNPMMFKLFCQLVEREAATS